MYSTFYELVEKSRDDVLFFLADVKIMSMLQWSQLTIKIYKVADFACFNICC